MAEEILDGAVIEGMVENRTQESGTDQLSHPDGSMTEKIESRDTGPERTEAKFDEILSRVAPAPSPASASDSDHKDDARSLSEMTDEESKVQKLLDLASTKGVVHAVKVAQSLGDYYALDRMHDELSYKLYQGLLERGLIEKE